MASIGMAGSFLIRLSARLGGGGLRGTASRLARSRIPQRQLPQEQHGDEREGRERRGDEEHDVQGARHRMLDGELQIGWK